MAEVARVTLQTIADRLGVSRMTVSNAFSNPDQLSAQLRERVLATAQELGYAGPDPAGRALARGTSGAVGILLTDRLDEAFTDEITTSFLAAIARELEGAGLALTLLTTGDDRRVPARDVAIDGALVYSCRPTSAARDWLLRRQLPIVYVDQEDRRGISSVNVDDEGGAAQAGRHIADLGHTDVVVLTYVVPGARPPSNAHGPDDYARTERERLAGWRAGLDAVEPTVVDLALDATDDEVRATIRDVLTDDARPTAVLCFSDFLAFHVIDVAHELGIAVPEQLSVVGFDDARSARLVTPRLTTIRQDVAMKGRRAAELLLAAIEARRMGKRIRAARVMLPTELVVRGSTTIAPNRSGHRTRAKSATP